MLKQITNKLQHLKLFNKVFLAYAIVIIVALAAVSTIVSSNISSMLLDKEIKYTKLIVYNVNSFFQKKLDTVMLIKKQAYTINSSGSNILAFLENDSDSSSLDYINTYPDFSKFFESVFLGNNDMSSVFVYKKLDNRIYMFSGYRKDGFDAEEYKYRDRLLQVNDISPNTIVYPAYKPFYQDNNYIYSLCTNLKMLDSYSSNTGILMIDFNVNGIYEEMKQYYENINADIMILTEDGSVIFDSSGYYYEKKYPYVDLLKSGASTIEIDGKKSLLATNSNNGLKVMVVGILPQDKVLSNIKSVQWTIYLISILCIVVSLLITYTFTFMFSKRIRNITQIMKKVQKGIFSSLIPAGKTHDELDDISESFNKMCRELEMYINRVYISQIKQKNAELLALQTQINPHFLYNTLEAIRVKAVKSKADDAAEMILILSKLFRYTVKGNAIIEIYEEVRYSMLYLELFKIRFGDRLSYSFEIPGNIQMYGIIRHVIQPVIENYILHGFDATRNDNYIEIKGYREEEFVCFRISDNGNGIKPEKLSDIVNSLRSANSRISNSIGLTNVNERIKIIFGDQCGVYVESDENTGTTVMVKILAKSLEELENVQSIDSR